MLFSNNYICINIFFIFYFGKNTTLKSIILMKFYVHNSVLLSVVQQISRTCLCSVQFSHSVVSNSLRPHEPQHARPPCPSPTPGVCPNPCPLSWCSFYLDANLYLLNNLSFLHPQSLAATILLSVSMSLTI